MFLPLCSCCRSFLDTCGVDRRIEDIQNTGQTFRHLALSSADLYMIFCRIITLTGIFLMTGDRSLNFGFHAERTDLQTHLCFQLAFFIVDFRLSFRRFYFHIEGNIYQIIEFQHVKPGKGAAFVRTKLKNIKSGGVVEKTFRPTEKCPQARIDRKDYQYLYADGDLYYFMDVETYDQIALSKEDIGDALKFVKENEMVKVCSHNGNVFAVEPPLFVEPQIGRAQV